ncbi:MAG: type II secretion system minor pseudopilin GspK [Verrucomicrobia bacterium]|nr:type II secretion system minor pseudopilin GspK [Verrucomicrobiota bacterium]
MTLRLAKRDRGIALIIVMIIVAALAVIVTGFAFSMRVENKLAYNTRFNPDMDWLGRSGVELARYLLSKRAPGEEQMDALHQKWAGGPGRTGMDAMAEPEPWEQLPMTDVKLGSGSFSIKITDMERKLNINSAPEPLIRYIIEMNGGVDVTDVDLFIDSLRDWIDPDDNPRLNGAESDDYLSEFPPYYSKNGPLDHITELKLVQGFKDEPGLYSVFANHFTAISGGLINVNTASAPVLGLLPGMTPEIAGDIVMYRAGLDGAIGTPDDMPYRSPNQIGEVLAPFGMDPSAFQQFLATESATFEVEVTAKIGSDTRKYISLLRRLSPQDIRILYFHSE